MRRVLGAWLLALVSATAFGQAPERTLKPGDPAPPFRVDKFLKGTPITAIEPGTIYVIEFWASWCGPCVQSMPYLSALQREFKDNKVVICGVSLWEEQPVTADTCATVEAYVARRGNTMDYRIAFDGPAGHMEKQWLRASGGPGLPWTMIVGPDGKLAWVGHATQAGEVLDLLTSGRWDPVQGPAALKTARTQFKEAFAKYKEGFAAGEAAWAAAAAAHPRLARMQGADRVGAMLAAGHDEAAFAAGRELVATVKASGDPTAAQNMMVHLAAHPRRSGDEYKALHLSAAEVVFALSDPEESAPHIVLARAYFATGNMEKGRAEAQAALARAKPEVRAATERFLREIEESFSK
jgi:thiol-disulfide isomerase/thioredoxin